MYFGKRYHFLKVHEYIIICHVKYRKKTEKLHFTSLKIVIQPVKSMFFCLL